MIPETRYARSGSVNIAYQVLGEGPRDLVYVPGWVSHIEEAWHNPEMARFLAGLASLSRLIRPRGVLGRRGGPRHPGAERGLAVHLAARVAAEAGPGEVLVSNTVHDLVAGSGLTFESLGRRSLKGVFGERELFCLTDGSSPSLPSAVARPPDAV